MRYWFCLWLKSAISTEAHCRKCYVIECRFRLLELLLACGTVTNGIRKVICNWHLVGLLKCNYELVAKDVNQRDNECPHTTNL